MTIQKINLSVLNKNKSHKAFKGASGSLSGPNRYSNDNERTPKKSNFTAGNLFYWAILANTLVVNPLLYNKAQNNLEERYTVYKTDETTQNLYKELKETFKQTEKTSNAFYQLNTFNNTEMPIIEKMGKNFYSVDFSINDKKIGMTVNTENLEDKKLSGDLLVKDEYSVSDYNYELNFKDAKTKTFDITLKSQDDSVAVTKTFERDYYGNLYLLNGKEKTLLNEQNLQKFQEKRKLENDRIDMNRAYRDVQETNYLICLVATIFKLLTYTPPKRRKED